METGNISLQYKVLLGYMILVVAVCGMVSILLYERDRMRTIRSETAEIRRIWHDISTAHRHITELATDGSPSLSGRMPTSVTTMESACIRTACCKH